ncbi:hypothetical protein Tsubulata_013464 [Turnera subulata]|uniref:Uncharacterized protein n=1 Tax=Turnera subulata TaxID=218843 RepID=A0A9Q0G8Z7_9ROSI|nr:hypothetical protein Tsubulata_013464 [Turnera subulata]
MMRLPPRRVSTPNNNNKRKEREGADTLKPLSPAKLAKPAAPPPPPLLQAGPTEKKQPAPAPSPLPSNQLLAGYLAHEYLTKGTLFGQPWGDAAEGSATKTAEPSQEAEPGKDGYRRYLEVSSLLNTDGAHLPDVINPTQLARLLHM